jgi:GTP-binding protein
MIPADSPDHRKEFEILRHELERYNPELLDKRFVVAISKCDPFDEELIEAIRKELAEGYT